MLLSRSVACKKLRERRPLKRKDGPSSTAVSGCARCKTPLIPRAAGLAETGACLIPSFRAKLGISLRWRRQSNRESSSFRSSE